MRDLPLLWRDGGLVAVNKPPGMLVVPGRREVACLRTHLETSLGQPVWVIHRLDRDTSGVVLFALDADCHRAANWAFQTGKVRKTYLALVSPPLEAPRLVEVPLTPARRGRMRLTREGEAGKVAQTRLRPLEAYARGGLVEAEPLTGRTHQIRLHLQAAGSPLLVDPQYGRPEALSELALGGTTDEVVLGRTPLHASRLVLQGSGILPSVDVQAPLPEDMRRALDVLRRHGPTVKGSD